MSTYTYITYIHIYVYTLSLYMYIRMHVHIYIYTCICIYIYCQENWRRAAASTTTVAMLIVIRMTRTQGPLSQSRPLPSSSMCTTWTPKVCKKKARSLEQSSTGPSFYTLEVQTLRFSSGHGKHALLRPQLPEPVLELLNLHAVQRSRNRVGDVVMVPVVVLMILLVLLLLLLSSFFL